MSIITIVTAASYIVYHQVQSFLQVSEAVILTQEPSGPDSLSEKKKLLDRIENYAKHICLTLNEQQEIYVGELIGISSTMF